MTVPGVRYRVLNGRLGVRAPTQVELHAYVGHCSGGPLETPTRQTRSPDVFDTFIGGPTPELAGRAIESWGADVLLVRTGASTLGSYGDIDSSEVAGTAEVTVDGSTHPDDEYEPYLVVDVGGNVGTDGIMVRSSLDNGRTPSPSTALGLADSFTFADSGGVKFLFGTPAAQVTAFIAAAVEARADTLAHLADVVAHDAADTSAEQVALAASGVPTTGAAAYAVMNLCRAALAAHRTNIAAHNGPDPVNVVSLGAATNVPNGIALYLEYKADFNAHLGIALAAAPAGLRAATATVAAEVVLTDADLLAAGLALLATYPRRLTFTTAGTTPADAPADVLIEGYDHTGAAQSETLVLAQTATMVTSLKAYKGPVTLTFPAADGTDATIAIGYAQGVHNSADVTNTLASPSPIQPTLVAGDTIRVTCEAPHWSNAELQTALNKLKTTLHDWKAVWIAGEVDAAAAAVIAAFLTSMELVTGKARKAYVGQRMFDTDAEETEAEYLDDRATDFNGFADFRITSCAADAWVLSARPGRPNIYRRPTIHAIAGLPAALPLKIDMAQTVDATPAGLPGVFLYDDNGNQIAHDEMLNPGLADARFLTLRTWAGKGAKVYVNNPVTLEAPGGDFHLDQFVRILCVYCTTARTSLVDEVSRDLDLNLQTNGQNMAGAPTERECQRIDTNTLEKLLDLLKTHVVGLEFKMHRDDVIQSSQTLNADGGIAFKGYPKQINFTVAAINPAKKAG